MYLPSIKHWQHWLRTFAMKKILKAIAKMDHQLWPTSTDFRKEKRMTEFVNSEK